MISTAYVLSAVALCLLAALTAASERVRRASEHNELPDFGHLDVLGERVVDEHHDIHDYPGEDYGNHDDVSLYDITGADKDDYGAFSHEKEGYPPPMSYSPPSYPQPSYPAPQPSYYQPSYSPPAPSYPKPSYPQPSYPQPSYPEPSYPEPSYPEPSYEPEPPTYYKPKKIKPKVIIVKKIIPLSTTTFTG